MNEAIKVLNKRKEHNDLIIGEYKRIQSENYQRISQSRKYIEEAQGFINKLNQENKEIERASKYLKEEYDEGTEGQM